MLMMPKTAKKKYIYIKDRTEIARAPSSGRSILRWLHPHCVMFTSLFEVQSLPLSITTTLRSPISADIMLTFPSEKSLFCPSRPSSACLFLFCSLQTVEFPLPLHFSTPTSAVYTQVHIVAGINNPPTHLVKCTSLQGQAVAVGRGR